MTSFPLLARFAFVAVLAASLSAQTEKVLFNFGSDGASPTAPLVEDARGNLYGVSAVGGTGCSFWCGVVFELSPPASKTAAWTETVIHNFGATPNDGIIPGPNAGLVMDKAGNLYGTTTSGGANCASIQGCGTVFELSPPTTTGGTWTETILYSFQGTLNNATDGFQPYAGVVFDAAGNLFGTTRVGGTGFNCDGIAGDCGTVFELSPPVVPGGQWTETIVHNFGSWLYDGGNPVAPLIISQGRLFGTTSAGGRYSCSDGDSSFGCGTVFQLDPPSKSGGQWTEHSVPLGQSQGGWYANGALVRGTDGKLYGTTVFGGPGACGNANVTLGCGTVFQITPAITMPHLGPLKTIYNFTGGADGAFPRSSLLTDKTGSFYGVASQGGLGSTCTSIGGGIRGNGTDCGTLFQVKSASAGSWTETTLHEFQGGSDGTAPWNVIRNRAGDFLGTTGAGGSGCTGGCGTFFEILP